MIHLEHLAADTEWSDKARWCSSIVTSVAIKHLVRFQSFFFYINFLNIYIVYYTLYMINLFITRSINRLSLYRVGQRFHSHFFVVFTKFYLLGLLGPRFSGLAEISAIRFIVLELVRVHIFVGLECEVFL